MPGDDPTHDAALLQLFDALTTWQRAGEQLHAAGIIRARSGVALKRPLHPVLFVVAAAAPTRVNDIATTLGILHSAASRLVSQLVEKGYVERTVDPTDGRASHVTLTTRGAAAHRALVGAWTSVFADALAACPEIDVGRLASAFSTFAAGVGRSAQSDG